MFRAMAKFGVGVAIGTAIIVGSSGVASAHDPIFVGDDQTTPDVGPYMPDGTISWALYGQVLAAGDTRGFEFDLRDGDELFVELLIPNLSPEVDLADDELPILELELPSGETTVLAPERREVFDEEFSRTSYVSLVDVRQPAEAGRYRGTVVGNGPARFTVAIGEQEIFFTETERSGDRPSSFAEIAAPLQAWYTTPPGADAPTELAEGEAEIDEELIGESLESGEARLDTDDAASESDEAVESDAAVESDPASESDEAVESDAALGADEAQDDGGSTTWVAPVVIGGVAAAVAAAFVVRRRRAVAG